MVCTLGSASLCPEAMFCVLTTVLPSGFACFHHCCAMHSVHFFASQWGLPVVCTVQCSGNVLECTDRKAKACSSSSATRGSCRWQRCHHLCHLLCHQAFVLSATFISIALQILQLPALQLPSLAVKLCRRHLNLQLPSLSTNIDAKSQSGN